MARNGRDLWTDAGPWRQHRIVLLGPALSSLLVVAAILLVATWAGSPWPVRITLAAPGLAPFLYAYLQWRQRRLFLPPTEIRIESGVVTVRSARFPLRDVDVLQTRQSLLGKMFDYGDVTIFTGPNAETFERLHSFDRFVAAYQTSRAALPRSLEPRGRFSALPSYDDPARLPLRELLEEILIEAGYQRSSTDLSVKNGK